MPEKLKSRASITEQTADWRAGCGRSARPVRRGERGESPVPTSIKVELRLTDKSRITVRISDDFDDQPSST